MANLASSISRLVLNITSSTPAVEWPNYGSNMHQAYLGRVPAYGHELGSRAGVANPHRGTDIRPAGGVKQNVASFTFDRYAKFYSEDKVLISVTYPSGGSGGSGAGGGWGGNGSMNPIYNYAYYTYANSTRHSVEHWPDTPSNLVGFCVDLFSLYRASHHHESYGASFVSLKVYYRTASNPGYTHVVNYGHILTWGIPWGQAHHQAFDRSLGAADGFIYFKVEVLLMHGMGNWHDAGDRSPYTWSPDIPICTSAHPVGLSSNYWRSISNVSRGNPVVDHATVYYKPTVPQLSLPKKHFPVDKFAAGNSYWFWGTSYPMPHWSGSPPFNV